MCCLFLEIFAMKIWSGRKLAKISHVFGPNFFFFWGGEPPNFLTCIIKFSQFPIMWQTRKISGRSVEGPRRTCGEKNTCCVKHKPVRKYRSRRPNNMGRLSLNVTEFCMTKTRWPRVYILVDGVVTQFVERFSHYHVPRRGRSRGLITMYWRLDAVTRHRIATRLPATF